MLPDPPNGDPYLKHIVAMLNVAVYPKEPEILGLRHDGTNLHLRFRPMRDIPWVRVHVQSTVAGEGGGTYDASNFTTSTEVECRNVNYKDVVIPDLPTDRYYVWLIPVQKDAAGTVVLYNGVGTSPDHMAFAQLGV